MRLCLSIEIQEGLSYADTLAMAREAERLGFHAALLAEHYSPSGPPDAYPPDEQRDSADAWLYLAALARDTQTIRLGTLVSPVTFRHPVVLAKLAATLDHLSNGRAELGIGAGWLQGEHAAYGFPFPPAPRRADLLQEQLQVISGLWSAGEQPFSHSGPTYELKNARFTPKPVQQPRPPIIVGGRVTSRRLPRLAARYADEFVIGQPTPEQARQTRALLDQACVSAARNPESVALSAFAPICIADSPAEVERHLATYRESNPQYVGMLGDTSTWLLGTPDDVRHQLAALAESGITRMMVAVNSPLHREMLPLLAAAL